MKLRILSDIHNEWGLLDLPVMEDEAQQVLVLAGDIGLAAKSYTYIPFLQEMSERFQDIIYIMGNHEYYDTSILRGLNKIKDRIKYEISAVNIHVADNEVIRIGNVSFVCSTLWASFYNMDAMCMYDAELHMTDHKVIRTGTTSTPYMRPFTPSDAASLFIKNTQFLFPAIKAEKTAGQKVVVVTHHAPSMLSIAEEYKTGLHGRVSGAYASSLEEDIFESKPDLMIHGHTHVSFDYELVDELYGNDHKTRILCNPRGYEGESLNPKFNPMLVVEV